MVVDVICGDPGGVTVTSDRDIIDWLEQQDDKTLYDIAHYREVALKKFGHGARAIKAMDYAKKILKERERIRQQYLEAKTRAMERMQERIKPVEPTTKPIEPTVKYVAPPPPPTVIVVTPQTAPAVTPPPPPPPPPPPKPSIRERIVSAIRRLFRL
jgi:hypothetical protein